MLQLCVVGVLEMEFSAKVLDVISNDTASSWWSVYGLVAAPAQKHATDATVYMASFFWVIRWGSVICLVPVVIGCKDLEVHVLKGSGH